MLCYLLSLRRLQSFISYESADNTTSYSASSNYSTLQKGDVSDCPCMTNNYTCIPDCCCAPKCSGFYSSDDSSCYEAPTSDLVKMCSSYSKDSVGSVSDWLMRVIFCVYRENNPLTSRGITYASPDADYENTALENSIASQITSTSSSYTYLTESDVETVTGADKSNRGYLFGQSVLDSNGSVFNFNASSGSVLIPIEFGVNIDFEFDIPNGTLPNATIPLLDNSTTISVRTSPYVTDTIAIENSNSSTGEPKFLGLSLSFLFKAVGYKQAPQYIIDSVVVNTTTSDFPEGTHAGLVNGTHVIGHIGFYELPNNQNLLDEPSSADENSWVPFNWRGANIN